MKKKPALLAALALAAVTFPCNLSAEEESLTTYSSTSFTPFTGKILDEKTSRPIVFANVVLKGTNVGTVTNGDGEFLIKAPVEWNVEDIEITHLGYQTKTIKLAGLKESVQFLSGK